MGKPRVVYVLASLADRALTFEWIAESSISRDFELSFALMNSNPRSMLQSYLEATGCPVHHLPFTGKRDLPLATWRLRRLFRRLRPHAVHAHLTGANLAALPAAAAAGVRKRVYTRHHATLNHDYYRHAVYYDRAANAMATDIVATCENGRQVLRSLEGVPDSKIHLIYFGFKLENFGDIPEARVRAVRRKYGYEGKGPVIGVVSKYLELKGVQYAIPAFTDVLARHPNAVLILANARPSIYSAHLSQLLSRLPQGSYREIVFEEDAPALYKTFDVFVHLPVDAQIEAFGQVYVEAMASRVPSVITVSGIASELARDGENALVAPYRDSLGTAQRILRLLDDPQLASRIASQADREVRGRFGLAPMIDGLARIYAP